MNRHASAFSARSVLALLIVGLGAFALFLYALGAGWNGDDDNGGAHADSNGLAGFSALAQLLERRGHEVVLSRDTAMLGDEALVVLTPQLGTDAEQLAEVLAERRDAGPTVLVLPKWQTTPVPREANVDGRVKPDWVQLAGASNPDWLSELAMLGHVDIRLGENQGWRGFGRSGRLPSGGSQSIFGPALARLVGDGRGGYLAAYFDDGGYYPTLAPAAGRTVEADDSEYTPWALVIVAEPDLLNNLGMADQQRAQLAVQLLETAMEGEDLPIVFDLTVAGLGTSRNLLTLAFQPPFLAATLCLALAALLIAWRAFRRFGPSIAELPELAHGKAQLARNGGALVERARRYHLLGPPYAAMVAARIAGRLGLREAQPEAREAALAGVLAARGHGDDLAPRLAALRAARHRADVLRNADALWATERTLQP